MSTYKDTDGRWRYRFSWRGTRYSGSTMPGHNTQKAAAALERAHIEKLEANVFTGVMPTLRDFVERFLSYQEAHTGKLTQKHQRRALRLHTVPTLGALRLDSIDTAEIDGLVTKWRAAGAEPRTCNARLDTIGRLFVMAIEWKLLKSGPTIRKVKVPDDTPRFLTQDEAARLLASAVEKWRSMMFIGLRTGLRIGELRGLQWADVDLSRRVIQVRRTDPGRDKLAASSPKGKRERTIPLTPEAAAVLALDLASAQHRAPADYVWPGFRSRTRIERGRARSENACLKAIHAAAAKAGIQGTGDDAIAWHSLRHTYASWLVLRGVPLRVVQELLGHASIRQTERYAHLAPNMTHHSAVADLDLVLVSAEPAPALPPGPANVEPTEHPTASDTLAKSLVSLPRMELHHHSGNVPELIAHSRFRTES